MNFRILLLRYCRQQRQRLCLLALGRAHEGYATPNRQSGSHTPIDGVRSVAADTIYPCADQQNTGRDLRTYSSILPQPRRQSKRFL